MINAYYAKTKLTFDDFIKKAYKEAKNNQERSYVKKYMRNSEKWGLYRRTHSPLLLQIKTTNAIESYHAQIKMRCEKTDSFLASMKKLDKVFKGKLNQQFKAKTDEKYKQLTEAQAYPELELFPMAFQVLIRNQFNIAVSNLESGEISKYQVSGAESPVCPCPFYQQYFLPCSHMFFG